MLRAGLLHLRADQVDHACDGARLDRDPGVGEQVGGPGFVALLGAHAAHHFRQTRRVALQQSQPLVERSAAGPGGRIVEVIATQFDRSEQGFDRLAPAVVALLPGPGRGASVPEGFAQELTEHRGRVALHGRPQPPFDEVQRHGFAAG